MSKNGSEIDRYAQIPRMVQHSMERQKEGQERTNWGQDHITRRVEKDDDIKNSS